MVTPSLPTLRRGLGPRPHPDGPDSRVEDAALPLQLPLPPPLQGGGLLPQLPLQPRPAHGAEKDDRERSAARQKRPPPGQTQRVAVATGAPPPPRFPRPLRAEGVAGPRGQEREAGGHCGCGVAAC